MQIEFWYFNSAYRRHCWEYYHVVNYVVLRALMNIDVHPVSTLVIKVFFIIIIIIIIIIIFDMKVMVQTKQIQRNEQ